MRADKQSNRIWKRARFLPAQQQRVLRLSTKGHKGGQPSPGPLSLREKGRNVLFPHHFDSFWSISDIHEWTRRRDGPHPRLHSLMKRAEISCFRTILTHFGPFQICRRLNTGLLLGPGEPLEPETRARQILWYRMVILAGEGWVSVEKCKF